MKAGSNSPTQAHQRSWHVEKEEEESPPYPSLAKTLLP